MTQSLKGNSITLTRGDTFKAIVTPVKRDGTDYEMQEGDTLRFAVKKCYEEIRPIFVKDIPADTRLLVIESTDTKEMPFGDYVYDIQLTKANGDVDTFIAKERFRLTEEVG